MPSVYEACRNSEYFPFLKFEGTTFVKSKVKFQCFRASMERIQTLAQNQHIKMSYENKDVAILVSDLSGFTKTTRKWGITHFASVIIRMR